jgi:aromatic ring-opening dioxygenase catalytic subunit (LigB family)
MSHKVVEVTVRRIKEHVILMGHCIGRARLEDKQEVTVVASGNVIHFQFPGATYETNISDLANAALDLYIHRFANDNDPED